MALGAHSPALGTGGSCAAADGVDERGFPRHAACDIGAFELQSAPTVTLFSESSSRWREGSAVARLTAARRGKTKVGTTFGVGLNEPAAVVLTFSRISSHKKVLGTLSFASVTPGLHAITFDGRLSGHRRLAPGAYLVTLSATNVGTSKSRSLRFTILTH